MRPVLYSLNNTWLACMPTVRHGAGEYSKLEQQQAEPVRCERGRQRVNHSRRAIDAEVVARTAGAVAVAGCRWCPAGGGERQCRQHARGEVGRSRDRSPSRRCHIDEDGQIGAWIDAETGYRSGRRAAESDWSGAARPHGSGVPRRCGYGNSVDVRPVIEYELTAAVVNDK